jgi:hypothetical protein
VNPLGGLFSPIVGSSTSGRPNIEHKTHRFIMDGVVPWLFGKAPAADASTPVIEPFWPSPGVALETNGALVINSFKTV